MVTLGESSSPVSKAPPAGAQNLFPAGMLGFSSFRGTVLVNTPTHVVAFATGRHSGGDVSARNVVVRTSTQGGITGSWSAPKIIANVSASSLQAGDGLYTGILCQIFLADGVPAISLLIKSPAQVRVFTTPAQRKHNSFGASA